MSIEANICSNTAAVKKDKRRLLKLIRKDFKMNHVIYFMVTPVLLYYIIFHFIPMYGVLIAFKDYSIAKGILNSPWIGFEYFNDFLNSVYFGRLMRNTFVLSIYDIIFGFPAPIILALMLNEIQSNKFKRTVQTISYLPHFVSIIVICGIITDFLLRDGLINDIIFFFGGKRFSFLLEPDWFRTIYVSSGIWQQLGWNSIIYLAALSSIDPELYQAAKIDGAKRWKQIYHITIPGILPTIIILFILRMGSILSVGFEKILLLYNPNTYETADVISTYVYRKGVLDAAYGFSSAVGLFNSCFNFLFLIVTNWLSKRITKNSLW